MSEAAAPGGNPFLAPAESLEERVEAAEELPEEWEVVFQGGLVRVRESKDMNATVLTLIQAGTVVLGFQEGDWLRLAGMPGYMALKLATKDYVEDSKPLLNRRDVSYLMSDGDCDSVDEYAIHDPAICKHAARMLGESVDRLWFKYGCQLQPPGQAESEDEEQLEVDEDSAAVPAPSPAAEDAGIGGDVADGGIVPYGRRAEGTEATEVWDDVQSEVDENAPTNGTGGAASDGGGAQLGHRAPDPEAASWEAFSRDFKTLCSTRRYSDHLVMPAPTATSVTSATSMSGTGTATTATLTGTTLTTLVVTDTTTTGVTVTPERWGTPSLFCFAVFRANTPEQELVKEACRLQSGIFACDTTVVISGEKIWIGNDKKGEDVWAWVNKVDEVTMGDINNHPGETTNSWLNTQIFINAIDMLVSSDVLWLHDWTVKGDPDAVLFPDRIRIHLSEAGKTGTPAFFENCFHDGRWWLYGSIEMFSKEAMLLYLTSGEAECKKGLNWKGWGEDYYMDECMKKLGAEIVTSDMLVGDQYCVPRDCSDGSAAAFHPFKTKDAWRGCLEASTGMSFPAE